jgi:hypothetical protein
MLHRAPGAQYRLERNRPIELVQGQAVQVVAQVRNCAEAAWVSTVLFAGTALPVHDPKYETQRVVDVLPDVPIEAPVVCEGSEITGSCHPRRINLSPRFIATDCGQAIMRLTVEPITPES